MWLVVKNWNEEFPKKTYSWKNAQISKNQQYYFTVSSDSGVKKFVMNKFNIDKNIQPQSISRRWKYNGKQDQSSFRYNEVHHHTGS